MTDVLELMSKRALAARTRAADVALWLKAISEVEQLRAALRPFADYADALDKDAGGPFPDTAPLGYAPDYPVGSRPNIGDCRRARSAHKGMVVMTIPSAAMAEPNMEAHLTMIRAFASVISPYNWRDMRLHIERQFQQIERASAASDTTGKQTP